jgi:hypothetical protein
VKTNTEYLVLVGLGALAKTVFCLCQMGLEPVIRIIGYVIVEQKERECNNKTTFLVVIQQAMWTVTREKERVYEMYTYV